jgi:Tfp pilus assembly protein PilF
MVWILVSIIIFCLFIISIILVRNIPKLRVINIESVPKEKARKVKEKIILQKLQRKSGVARNVVKASSGAVRVASKYGRRAVQKLYSLEQYYQKLKRTAEEGVHSYNKDEIRRLIDQAKDLVKKDEVVHAEKIYIDIISHNPKSVDAYEGLGDLYKKSSKYDQAKETYKFTLKISPNDASVLVSLAEMEMDSLNYKSALDYLKKAIDNRSKNPKYLDFYIETSLRAGSLKDARKGITLLQEVNPENKKLDEFEDRFYKLKDEYIQKTSDE